MKAMQKSKADRFCEAKHEAQKCKLQTEKRIQRSKVYKQIPLLRYFACILIQIAIRAYKKKGTLKKVILPSLQMLGSSTYRKQKLIAKAYVQGWKTRKILNTQSIKNHITQIDELNQYYASDGPNNKYVVQAKDTFMKSVRNAINNPNWWKDMVKSKTLQEKRERVKKMREKQQRHKDTHFELKSNGPIRQSTANINDYTSNKSIDSGISGGFSLAFDFSKTTAKQKKTYEEELEEKRLKKVEENRQQKKTQFLKRRANLKYDPLKAVEDDKVKKKIINQSEVMSEVIYHDDDDSVYTDNISKLSASKINLGALIEREKQRKLKNKRLSVKEIMNSSKPSIDKQTPDVTCNFQKLGYLKNVPKRIDCWLSKDKSKISSDEPQTTKNQVSINKKLLERNSSSGSLIEKSPKIVGSKQKYIEDFSEFSKSINMNKQKQEENSIVKTKNVNLSRDYQYASRINDLGSSYDSLGISGLGKLQQSPLKTQIGDISMNNVTVNQNARDSLFTNEGECLEFILDRLEGKSNYNNIISSTDKLAIREDKGLYSQLVKTKSLLEIFKLMNQVEKLNEKPSAGKQSYDFEFEKLLLKLKEEYNGLFQQNKVDKEIKHNINARYYSKRVDTEEEVELKSSSRRKDYAQSIDSSNPINTSRTQSKYFVF